MKKFILYQSPVILWSLTIFALSSISKVPTVRWVLHPDKIAHAIVYGVLGLAAYRALAHQDVVKVFRENPAFTAVVFAALYGFSDEFHQRFVPGRTPDIYDLLTDIIGAAIAVGSLVLWNRWRARQTVR